MRHILLVPALLLLLVSVADARCVGPRYDVRLGTELSIHRDSDGSPCQHTISGSRDPIYGIDVKSNPRHGSLSIVRRLSIVYRPTPGFRGEDAYSFQWVGKQGGITPSAMTIHVSVTIR